MGLKSGVAEWEFETYLVKFETYSVIRDYETKKTAGAPEPPEPHSLAPMQIHFPKTIEITRYFLKK